MKKRITRLKLMLQLWYYRRYFNRTVHALIYRRKLHPTDAVEQAAALFEWRFFDTYANIINRKLAALAALRPHHPSAT